MPKESDAGKLQPETEEWLITDGILGLGGE